MHWAVKELNLKIVAGPLWLMALWEAVKEGLISHCGPPAPPGPSLSVFNLQRHQRRADRLTPRPPVSL